MVTPGGQNTPWQVAGARLRQGQTVRTGNAAVRLEAEEVGRVDLAANSVLRATGGRRAAGVRVVGDPKLLVRSACHHGARALGTGLGARAERLPGRLVRRLSLERRG